MRFRLILPANTSHYQAILHICTLAGATLVVRSIAARELAQHLTGRGGKLLARVLGAVWPPSVVFSTASTSKHQSEPSDLARLHARRLNTGHTGRCGPGTASATHRTRRKTTDARFGCCVATIGCVLYSFQLAIAPRNKSNVTFAGSRQGVIAYCLHTARELWELAKHRGGNGEKLLQVPETHW